ncbi:MAG: von Willebrand factor type A domain-containing protein, partial [Balneola sp.]
MKIFTIVASFALFISCTGSYYSSIYQPNLQAGEEYETISENTFLTPSEYPLSTFAIDVDGAAYSNVRRMIMDGRLPVKDAVRVEEMINYFSYNYKQPRNEEPFSVHTDIGPSPW